MTLTEEARNRGLNPATVLSRVRRGWSKTSALSEAIIPREHHGMVRSPTYKTWIEMRARCYNPKHASWDQYGARGVRVCMRWRKSFKAFLRDMGPRPSLAHSIDRLDSRANYKVGNCRWATIIEQARNRKSNVVIARGGIRLCATDWALRLGLHPKTIMSRVARGETDPEKILYVGNLKQRKGNL